ncbi:hypothetical protein TI06_22835, partial [Vibrio vulnificus]
NPHHFAGAFVATQAWTHRLQVGGDLLAIARHRAGAEAFGDQGDFRVVTVLLAARQVGIEIAQVGLEKAADLGDMHPGQQVRVAGGIGRAVGQLADDAFVDAPDPLDPSLGIGQRTVHRHAGVVHQQRDRGV